MRNRREARESALQSLYAEEVGKHSPQDIVQNVMKPALKDSSDTLKFAEKLFYNTVDHAPELDGIIDDHIRNWKVERLAIIDKVILRMALTEMLYFPEIPTKVSINEAIELAKKFSTKKSGTFVNGILDAARSRLSKEGRIQKKGRGLIEESGQA
jgi:N utilization substance protein B